jgi:hypothetical protein
VNGSVTGLGKSTHRKRDGPVEDERAVGYAAEVNLKIGRGINRAIASELDIRSASNDRPINPVSTPDQ